MTRVDLAALIASIAGDRQAAERHAELALSLVDRLDDGIAQVAFAASLHHFYSALESIAERVLKGFGQTVPSGERWHQDLLEAAALEVPDHRPAVFSSESVPLLRKSLSFRHFFRHAYAASWDRSELQHNGQILQALLPLVRADLDAFQQTLADALNDSDPSP